jgi:hypothetical protein
MDHTQDREVRFFGRVAASFTHELKNVLAIVRETAGLMDDLLAMTPEGSFTHQPRFQRGVVTILEQVSRGVGLATRMNRFAHSPDHPVASVDLNEAMEQVCFLSERLARIRGVALSVATAEAPVTIVSSPVKVLLGFFKAYECCWNNLAPGGSVRGAVTSGPRPMVRIQWSGEGSQGPDFRSALEGSAEWRELLEVMKSIEGRVDWGDGAELVLELPQGKAR